MDGTSSWNRWRLKQKENTINCVTATLYEKGLELYKKIVLSYQDVICWMTIIPKNAYIRKGGQAETVDCRA